jgi:hypothetical protein
VYKLYYHVSHEPSSEEPNPVVNRADQHQQQHGNAAGNQNKHGGQPPDEANEEEISDNPNENPIHWDSPAVQEIGGKLNPSATPQGKLYQFNKISTSAQNHDNTSANTQQHTAIPELFTDLEVQISIAGTGIEKNIWWNFQQLTPIRMLKKFKRWMLIWKPKWWVQT